MIKLLFYLVVIVAFALYFFVLSHLPKVKWWQDLGALTVTLVIYGAIVHSYYSEQRIGEITLILSTALLALFLYKGIKSMFTKLLRKPD